MTELALETLRGAGLRQIRVANRTRARAAELAGRFLASAHGLDELPALLAEVDVVLTSIGGDGPVLGLERVAEAVRGRRHRPLFVIDIGVPRNVDPRVDELEEVFLYDIDDLGALAEANAEERRRETVRAEAIVLEEQQRFDGWLAALGAVPTIRDLRDRAEAIRTGEVERAVPRLALDDAQRAGVEALTRALVNKLLHAPLARLREHADREQGFATLEAARALFGLDEGGPDEDGGDEAEPPPGDPEAGAGGEGSGAP
jgi:glutamyl-tRNA reductase